MASQPVKISVSEHSNIYTHIGTYDNSSNASLWVAVLLQVLRDCGEDTWWQSHIEDPVRLLASLLKLIQVLVQLNKRLILVVLSGDVGASTAKICQLLFHILRGSFDVGLDPLEVLLMVHLCSRISNDLDIFWKELVAVLSASASAGGLMICNS
jgi:hypothetical protein